MSQVVLVHGSVETSEERAYIDKLSEAAAAGFDHLDDGVSAAEEAIKVLEDSPLFNAGTGSVLNRDGEVEMDAALADGRGGFGAVACIREVRHPVSVARRVMEETRHIFLAGEGATGFAREHGFETTGLVTGIQRRSWEDARKRLDQGQSIDEISLYTGVKDCDTIGCVVAGNGHVAAASSTGGSFLKLPGRVGDTPVCGGGIFASEAGAVVCTGLGEAFVQLVLAKRVELKLQEGMHPQAAAEWAIKCLKRETGATGGLLVVDRFGRHGAAHNCSRFPVAIATSDGTGKYEPAVIG